MHESVLKKRHFLRKKKVEASILKNTVEKVGLAPDLCLRPRVRLIRLWQHPTNIARMGFDIFESSKID